MSDPVQIADLLGPARAEIERIERAVLAADLEGVGVLVVRDQHGALAVAAVCDDVPAGQIVEADEPLQVPATHVITAPPPRARQRRYKVLRQPAAGPDAAEVA